MPCPLPCKVLLRVKRASASNRLMARHVDSVVQGARATKPATVMRQTTSKTTRCASVVNYERSAQNEIVVPAATPHMLRCRHGVRRSASA